MDQLAASNQSDDASLEPASLAAAREAYQQRAWDVAQAGFLTAEAQSPLGADDTYLLGSCAWWLADVDAAVATYPVAYERYLEDGRPDVAAVVAVNLGYVLALRGDEAHASGWLSRGHRLVADLPECAAHGYLDYIEHETALRSHEVVRAAELADRVHYLGQRTGDPALVALGVLGQGLALVGQGETVAGMAQLDEAMVAAASDELDPTWTGHIYCQLIETCYRMGDLRRAWEWTRATERWCATMPSAGPFIGICRVHRAQVLQSHGEWDTADHDLQRVCEELADFDLETVSEARYARGELLRRRGDRAGAEAEFHAAHQLGRDPQPGLALLRAAEGRSESALASIRAALAATGADRLARARLLPAAVDIALSAGDVDQARIFNAELTDVAAGYVSSGLVAAAHQARGAVLLHEDRHDDALRELREAIAQWQHAGAAYEAARARTLLAEAYRAVGDHDAAHRERAAANARLREFGAAEPARRTADRPAGLTERETEVLGLIATGKSNNEIASGLVLSIRTVERHLATIYQKLGLSGRSARAAAVTFAHREGMAPPP